MTEAEMNARAAANPSWFRRYFLDFMALCLKHYEDTLREEHAALLSRSRAHPNSLNLAYMNPRFCGGLTDFMGNRPLFWNGGLPRYFGAVGDIRERNRLFSELSAAQRAVVGLSSAYPKLSSLHRRMFMFDRESRTPWQRIQHVYRTYYLYASGGNDRAEMLGYGIAGALMGAAGFRSLRASVRRPGPIGSNRRTLPGIGPGPEDLGHAATEPGSRPPGPVGIRDTVNDIGSASTLPGAERNTGPPPVEYQQIVERTAAEVDGALGRGGPRLQALELETARALDGSVAGSVAYYFPEGNFEARQAYAQSWRQAGGTGIPPEHGFVVRNANGETEFIAMTFRPQRLPNARLVSMTAQQRDGIVRADMVNSNQYQARTGYEFYASDWRAQGGQGPPPEFGFLIMAPDGTVVRAVGYHPEGLGPEHL